MKKSRVALFLLGFVQIKANFTNWWMLLASDQPLIPFWNYIFFTYMVGPFFWE